MCRKVGLGGECAVRRSSPSPTSSAPIWKEDVRELPLYLNPQSEHYLDRFHIAMRITVMSQFAKGLRSRDKPRLAEAVLQHLEP